MQQINDLKQEIKGFETEIAKLKQELTIIGGYTLELATSNDPSEIAKSFRLEAQKIVDRAPAIQGIKNAIAELTSRLNQKQSQLQDLEAVELKKQRQNRIIEGRSRLRAKFADVEAAAKSLQNLYFDLKAIAAEYEKDFAQIHPPTSGGTALNRNSLLNIEPLTIPQFVEEKERQLLLPIKRSQLAEYKDARRNTLAGLKTANVSDFDDTIASLEVEIESLQKPVQL